MKPQTTDPMQPIDGVVMRVTIWLIVFFNAVIAIVIVAMPPHPDPAANQALVVLPAVVAVACLIAFGLAKLGYPRIGAALVMSATYIAIVEYLVATGLGLHSHVVGLLTLCIIGASLLIGHKVGLVAAAIAVITVILMFILESGGLVFHAEAARTLQPGNIAVVYLILFSATCAMLFLFSRALNEALESAALQEQHLRDVIEFAPFAYLLHRDGRLLLVNKVAARVAGAASPEAMIGTSMLALMPEAQREFASQRIAAVLGDEHGASQPAEYRLRGPRGEERFAEAMTKKVQLTDGPALLTVMRDVTHERRATRELAVAKEEAEAANLAKSQFLANMSHEIRTPLNGVLGMADLLHGTALNEDQRRYCDAITASGRALRDLLRDVLDLAKIEAGKIELAEEDFDLVRLVDELATSHGELAKARGNRFESASALGAAGWLSGDTLRLRQILSNLLGNAVKFTENGVITMTATVLEPRVRDVRTWVRFEIRDTGVGMNAETLAKLFKPFSQADSSTTRRFGGTGLGLTIVSSLTHAMGGLVRVESNIGAGAIFSVEIPFEPARTAKPQVAAAAESLPEAAAPLRVLVVEDNEINLDVACALLEAAGHAVEVARDGAEALSKWEPGRYDCVFMDCQMPVMDGFDATRAIRRREAELAATRTRIVALTANAMAGDREAVLAAGMDDFLAKPVESAALLAALRVPAAQAAR